jgi:hypothetical protein
MPRFLPLAILALLGIIEPLAGQSTVVGMRDLAFGAVIRGVATTVSPDDPIRSGRFYVRHVLGRSVQLRLTLPSQLARVGGGGNLAISFRNGDAMAQLTAPGSPKIYFNPKANKKIDFTTSADLFVNLGGQVSPTANQPTGNYRGSMVLTCTFF